jgi:small subunit ribosomal protein S4
MTKRIQAKHKVDRRLGVNLWGRPKSPFNTRAFGPGQHGQTRARGKPSDYKIQLQAKQKLKGYYGNLNERQFRNVFQEAERVRGNTGENLVGILESRLDAVVYRAKFALTVFQARQIINHGHIKVNGKKVNVGSYSLKENDEIEVRDSSKQLTTILSSVASKEIYKSSKNGRNSLSCNYGTKSSSRILLSIIYFLKVIFLSSKSF